MRLSFGAEKERGLTLVELLVVIAIIAVFACMIVPASTPNKARAMRLYCVNNLKQTGLAFRIWEGDHGDRYPMAVPGTNGGTMEFTSGPTAFRHFLIMSNELPMPKTLTCPADSERVQATTFDLKPNTGQISFTSNSNLSYFVGLDAVETDPQNLLTGDRNITNGTSLKNGVLELTSNHRGHWTDEMHRKVGNIALADGSVQQVRTLDVTSASTNMPAFTNRLLMPVLGP